MRISSSKEPQNLSATDRIRTTTLYALATAALLSMAAVMNPSLLLPLTAFVVMAVSTGLLGRRLFNDLTAASDHSGDTGRT